jgi:cytoskeleton protein RodZ
MGAVIPDLHAIRNHRGLSLREIAELTKIRVFYLEAIENGKFEKLPGGVYTKSYVRQYAKAIDFDEAALLRALPPDPDPEHEQRQIQGWRRVLMWRPFRHVWTPSAAGEPASRRFG